VGIEKVRGLVKEPLDIKVASHYGCHLLKPSKVIGFENPFNAHSLEDIATAVGGVPVDYEERDLCCGLVLGSTHADGSMDLAHKKLSSAKDAKADAVIVTCPTCFLQFDTGQLRAGRKFQTRYDLPVLYFTQLIGLAAGFGEKDLGLHAHRIKVKSVLDLIEG